MAHFKEWLISEQKKDGQHHVGQGPCFEYFCNMAKTHLKTRDVQDTDELCKCAMDLFDKHGNDCATSAPGPYHHFFDKTRAFITNAMNDLDSMKRQDEPFGASNIIGNKGKGFWVVNGIAFTDPNMAKKFTYKRVHAEIPKIAYRLGLEREFWGHRSGFAAVHPKQASLSLGMPTSTSNAIS